MLRKRFAALSAKLRVKLSSVLFMISNVRSVLQGKLPHESLSSPTTIFSLYLPAKYEMYMGRFDHAWAGKVTTNSCMLRRENSSTIKHHIVNCEKPAVRSSFCSSKPDSEGFYVRYSKKRDWFIPLIRIVTVMKDVVCVVRNVVEWSDLYWDARWTSFNL